MSLIQRENLRTLLFLPQLAKLCVIQKKKKIVDSYENNKQLIHSLTYQNCDKIIVLKQLEKTNFRDTIFVPQL